MIDCVSHGAISRAAAARVALGAPREQRERSRAPSSRQHHCVELRAVDRRRGAAEVGVGDDQPRIGERTACSSSLPR